MPTSADRVPYEKDTESGFEILRVRKLADTEGTERVKRYNPITGEPMLIDPSETDVDDLDAVRKWRHKPWPLAGIQIIDPPQKTVVDTGFIGKAVGEGWVQLEDSEVVHRPGGPPEDLWRVTHTFVHCKAINFQTVDGVIRYVVTRQPDKYANEGDDVSVSDEIYENGNTHVSWFYQLERDDG